MNRYLAVPCVLSFAAFGVVCFALALPQGFLAAEYSAPINSTLAPGGSTAGTVEPIAKLATLEQASTLILDGWPTRDGHDYMSRVRVRQEMYAKLGPLVQNWSADKPNFLCSLDITATGGRFQFPVNFDRETNEIHIFDNRIWHPYAFWRDENLVKFSKGDVAGRLFRIAQPPTSIGDNQPQ